MEQLNQLYDRNVGENVFSASLANQALSQGKLNKFLQKLLSSIDLPVLSELFYQQLQNTLQLSGIKIQFNHAEYSFGDIDKASNIKNLNYQIDNIPVAAVKYGFNRTLTTADWQILQQLHMLFSNPVKNALEHYEVKQMAMKDFLTTLGNRSSYHETIQRLLSEARRHHNQFGLLVIDMDRFKRINDNFGHVEGDKVLRACAQTIAQSLRDTDFAFRFGGDEFCCLLPQSNSAATELVAQRIKQAVADQSTILDHGISCSIGRANYQPEDSEQSLFARADRAMYQIKKAGRRMINSL